MISRIQRMFYAFGNGPVGRGAILSLSIRLAMIVLSFSQAALFARTLGAEQYGIFSFVLSITSLIASIGLIGSGEFAVRAISKLKVQDDFFAIKRFVKEGALLVVGTSISCYCVYLVLVSSFGAAETRELKWGILLCPLLASLFFLRGVSQGFGSVVHSQAPLDLLRPILIVAALIVVYSTPSVFIASDAIALFLVTSLIALIIAILFVAKKLKKTTSIPLKKEIRLGWLKDSLPFFGLTLLMTLHMEIGTLMLAWLSNQTEVGLFQPLLRVAPVMAIAAYAVSVPLTPRISELWERKDKEKLRQIIWQSTLVTTAAVTATCIVILVAAPLILGAFGPEFVSNASALIWIAIAQIFGAASGPLRPLLTMTGLQGLATKILAFGLVINGLLSILLIPQHGAYGAALAFSVTTIFANGLMIFVVRRRLFFDPSLVASIVFWRQKRKLELASEKTSNSKRVK